ncbi:hypothetical protein [Rudanella lutea]|uniref:hypothetical protein n=1 Tax=Rudanella lutea TaxID=451374 RepID=UPI000369697B|nr:hypothetical protein [Rudanella lutea]
MRHFFMVCPALLLTLPALAQTTTPAAPVTVQNMQQWVGSNTFGVMQRIDTRYEGVQGSPYFLNDWSLGRVDLVTGRNYESVPIKYDAYSQNLVLKRPQANDSIIVYPNQVKQFVLRSDDGAEWLFRRFADLKTDDTRLRGSYFLVLYDGKTSLLKRVGKEFRQADFKSPYSTDTRYDAYTNEYTYFVLKPDQTITKVKKGKKGIIEALSDKNGPLETYIKGEKLDAKTDAELAQIVKYYDSL